MRAVGRAIHNDQGPVLSAWVTAFPLVGLVAHGREHEAIAFLDWMVAEGFTGGRCLSCWGYTGNHALRFTPGEGIAALPRTLELARDRGLYLMPVAVVDSTKYDEEGDKAWDIDWPAHLRKVGDICAAAFMPMEGGQEIPHETQHDDAGDWVCAYRPPAGVLYCEASVHAANDCSKAFADGAFICTHVLRNTDQVKRHNQVADTFYPMNKPYISMEPDKAMDQATWYNVGRTCRSREMGLTFHHQDVSYGKVPTGAALECARAMLRGLRGE